MQKKMLSVCCLGYNHAKFIEANINAIISSKYEAIEIIAVDDGSSDGSGEILKSLEKKSGFPMHLIFQENTGSPARNFNRAIVRASGEFITFISLDDVLNMPEIDKMLEVMNADSSIAFMAGTNFDIIDASGNVTENRKLPIYKKLDSSVDEMLEFEYSRFESFWLQGTVFRREIVDAVGGFDEDMLADDIVLRTKVLRFVKEHSEFAFILTDSKVFLYRLHGSNISGNTVRQIKAVTQYLDRYWPDKDNPRIYNEWLSYGIRVYDKNIVKSLFISDKRLAQSINDEEVMLGLMGKIWFPIKTFQKKHICSRLYFDIGNGFSEKSSIPMHYDSNSNAMVSFSLPYENITALRFDPAEESGGLRLYSLKILKNDGSEVEVDLKTIQANNDLKIGETCVFTTNDPCIVFGQGMCTGAVSVRIGFDWLDSSELIPVFQNEISLYNSYSWKLSKPVRIAGKSARKILPKKVKKALKILKNCGIKGFLKAIKNKLILKKTALRIEKAWTRRHDFFLDPIAFGMKPGTCKAQNKNVFPKKIKFSILVPLYNTPKNFLQEMIGSVLFQTYSNWELCLADGSDSEHSYVQKICEEIAKKDSRIKYRKLEKNGGISGNTNGCIKMATGDYISLFDHDDLLHPAALFETMKAICEKDADFVYTDEAVFKSPHLSEITFSNFKPDFAPEYFHSLNYICHFTSFKRSLLEKVGEFNSEYDGAQDYDMFLRLTEIAEHIVHVPKCLYYWRSSPSSTASSAGAKGYTTVAGKKALEKHFERIGVSAEVLTREIPNTYHIKYRIKDNPLVSIMIPSYEHWRTLKKCIDSIRKLSTYKNYEIIIIENNSKDKETFDYYETLELDGRIKIVTWKGKFNYSAINNFGFKYAEGEYVVLLNNDIEVITPEWIEEMLMFAQRGDVGAVGAMLYYPSDKIQHAGVILGIGGVAGHSHRCFPRGNYGYASRLASVQNYSCVTAACLMVSSKIYREVNGLDESFEVAFNDVDFCMRIRKAGYLNVWTPFAELYHHESESRGYEDTPEKVIRFEGESARFKQRWSKELAEGDPFYNQNLSLNTEDFAVTGEVFPKEVKRRRWIHFQRLRKYH